MSDPNTADELTQLQAQLDAIREAEPVPEPAVAPAENEARVYRVQSNDSLISIAAAHQTTPEAILAANAGTLINDNLIVGQAISLPA